MGIDPERHKIPPLLNHHLKDMGNAFTIAFDDEPDKKYEETLKRVNFEPEELVPSDGYVPHPMISTGDYPLIVILGLDPKIHKIPPLLGHYLKKLGKDFVVFFDAEPPEKYEPVLKQVGYEPVEKDKIVAPKSKIITEI